MPPVRIGFIGCGTHATQNLYPSLRYADCELVAVADLYEERREHCKRAFGAARAYDDGERLLDAETDLDAVMVCGPAEVHHRFALAALERGLPVFTDKPPARTLDAAIEIRDAARAAGQPCMVGLMKRFAQKHVAARRLTEADEFGGLTHLLLRYSWSSGAPRASKRSAAERLHGTLTGMCIHAIDLATHFLGPVERVQVARGGPGEGVLNLAVNLLAATGATGTVIVSNSAAVVTERLELTGRNAHLVVDELAELSYYPPAEETWQPPFIVVRRPNFPLQTRENCSLHLQGYAGEVCEFVDAVRENRPPSAATIDDAVYTMRLLDAIERTPFGHTEIESD